MSAADADKAVEAAALVLARLCGTESLGDNSLSDRWRNDARAVLTAAIPILVPAIGAEARERIATAIEDHISTEPTLMHVVDWRDGMETAAGIARGDA